MWHCLSAKCASLIRNMDNLHLYACFVIISTSCKFIALVSDYFDFRFPLLILVFWCCSSAKRASLVRNMENVHSHDCFVTMPASCESIEFAINCFKLRFLLSILALWHCSSAKCALLSRSMENLYSHDHFVTMSASCKSIASVNCFFNLRFLCLMLVM